VRQLHVPAALAAHKCVAEPLEDWSLTETEEPVASHQL
jgi:hypothetical protein